MALVVSEYAAHGIGIAAQDVGYAGVGGERHFGAGMGEDRGDFVHADRPEFERQVPRAIKAAPDLGEKAIDLNALSVASARSCSIVAAPLFG